MQKVRIGGIIQNDHLASLSVLAVKDRPGIAAAVLDAWPRKPQRAVRGQVIDQHHHTQMVLCVDRTDLAASLEAIEAIRPRVMPQAIATQTDVASVAIFGPDFRQRPGIAGRMFRALADHGVNILAISTSISTINCIVELSRLPDALRAIHEHFELP